MLICSKVDIYFVLPILRVFFVFFVERECLLYQPRIEQGVNVIAHVYQVAQEADDAPAAETSRLRWELFISPKKV